MGGFFGVVSRDDCVTDLFFGTDYHFHLGTRRGGLAVLHDGGVTRFIKDISNAQFRSKMQADLPRLRGRVGIGVISDTDDQPILFRSHLGLFAISTVGVIRNAEALAARIFAERSGHFSEVRGGAINPTELVAALLNQEATFEDGIRRVLEVVEGSCSLLVATPKGLYAARDRFGRTPVTIGAKDGARAATLETSALPNLGYRVERYLGPGEAVFLTAEGDETRVPPGDRLRICSFLWVYYGYPASSYEGINVEAARYRCGERLAARDDVAVDTVAGIPDSGVGHAIGYAAARGLPYRRPFVKYTPTWPRSFMPPNQSLRDLVARMKLIPIDDLIRGQRLLFCDDSIVRGTQLQDTIRYLFERGAKEVHMRPACPPLVYACPYLNFSRSRSEMDLAARRAIREIEGRDDADLARYADPDSEAYAAMVERIRVGLRLTTLRYQRLGDLVEAIGLPKHKLCTFCWDGVG
ncbi:MAG: amidophosphoribosyltransferase [Myxococcales bacterium]|nr:amidophosphoribosyltransferase [Myxococcales bacterium]